MINSIAEREINTTILVQVLITKDSWEFLFMMMKNQRNVIILKEITTISPNVATIQYFGIKVLKLLFY